jgi:Icc-related predicted phosphoesterase
MASRVTRVLCAADPRGSEAAVRRLRETAADRGVHAIALVGDLGGGADRRQSYRTVFRALAGDGIPAYWVPGPGDAPVGDYLREAHSVEVVTPLVRGVHGTAAFAPGYLVVAGLGGAIDDDPDSPREEVERLAYPRWEAEYRLKLLAELGEHERLLVFATPPAHKGRGIPGSEAVAELIGTWRPRLAVCGGPRETATIGRTLVVAPGSLAGGQYAVADLHSHDVELGELVVAA